MKLIMRPFFIQPRSGEEPKAIKELRQRLQRQLNQIVLEEKLRRARNNRHLEDDQRAQARAVRKGNHG